MNMCGNQPPINVKNKDKWINRERQRWAALLNVPMAHEQPPSFPPKTLPIMRTLAAMLEIDCGRQDRLVCALDALWQEFFVKHTATHEPSELKRVLEGAIGGSESIDEILTRASSDEEWGGKKALKRHTDDAFENGAFGVPWMICTRADGKTESFFGVDHLGQVAAFLGLEKPTASGWKALL
jgi:2-hydroxychromene-2-carboxylate isomerase